jgi:hypothetical protein|tara:strand:- start:190 stop:363 length:174 start_codon:yes stop_codon:yes gene_type:complete
MSNYMPKNSINTPLDKSENVERLQKENERVRQNNVDLKLQIIDARKTINKIRELIKK